MGVLLYVNYVLIKKWKKMDRKQVSSERKTNLGVGQVCGDIAKLNVETSASMLFWRAMSY